MGFILLFPVKIFKIADIIVRDLKMEPFILIWLVKYKIAGIYRPEDLKIVKGHFFG